MSDRYEFTLVGPDGGDVPGPPRALRAFRAMPLTASSELRADADLRRLSDRLSAQYPQLEWYEVLCQQAEPSQAGEIPAVALLDSRLPILICLYDSSAFFSVDAELTQSTARRAFRSVESYVETLEDCGYSIFVDHARNNVSAVPAGRVSIGELLVLSGQHRWYARLRYDSTVWFFCSWIGFILFVLAYGGPAQEGRFLGSVVLIGSLVGAAFAAFHYAYERDQLRDRLREMRDIVVTPPGTDQPVRFAVPSVWPDVLTTLGLLGGLAVMGWLAGGRLVPMFLAVAAIVAVTYLLACLRGYILLGTNGIEGLGPRGRCYLPFEQVDGVEQSIAFEYWTVRSAARGTIWIPRKLVGREQLVDLLTERVRASWMAAADPASEDDALAASVEGELQRSRRQRWFGGVFGGRAARPLWLWLMRRHPLRPQYDWTTHLLARGHVRIAHVVSPPPGLLAPEDDWTESMHALLIVVAETRGWRGAAALCSAIEATLAQEENPGNTEIEQFCLALDKNAGFPLMLRVPSNLVDGHTVYCASTLASRRDIPLGRLHSRWLPVMIDPQACPFAMVVPLRYWGRVVRRSWKGDGTAPAGSARSA